MKTKSSSVTVDIKNIKTPVFVSKEEVAAYPSKYPKERLFPSRRLNGYYLETNKQSYYPIQEIAAALQKAGARGYLVVADKAGANYEVQGSSIDFPEERAFYFYKTIPVSKIDEEGESLSLLLDAIAIKAKAEVWMLGGLSEKVTQRLFPAIGEIKRICGVRAYLKAVKSVRPIEKETGRTMRGLMIGAMLAGAAFGGWELGNSLVKNKNNELDGIYLGLRGQADNLQKQLDATEKEYNLIEEIKSNKKALK